MTPDQKGPGQAGGKGHGDEGTGTPSPRRMAKRVRTLQAKSVLELEVAILSTYINTLREDAKMEAGSL